MGANLYRITLYHYAYDSAGRKREATTTIAVMAESVDEAETRARTVVQHHIGVRFGGYRPGYTASVACFSDGWMLID